MIAQCFGTVRHYEQIFRRFWLVLQYEIYATTFLAQNQYYRDIAAGVRSKSKTVENFKSLYMYTNPSDVFHPRFSLENAN